ncbi:hypothetical protein CANCADRAFT_55977 [Tortispora caseinolytica NRRL Y-17796]|uniref:Ribosomal RNA-processing protein 44 n=1 Tax=Tortispora caseinolytica NRRL Y-17796 TaxID=767744 RepID=A0A1E4TKJ0_9ASCO|nr:hypothetical protein CANCADRAFT_55977 [Tortispora caseinolytica NRRL Y-17796]
MPSKRKFEVSMASESATALDHVSLRSVKGKCVKIVREQYLRTDIPCRSLLCTRCNTDLSVALPGSSPMLATLSSAPPSTDSLGPHYAVPDLSALTQAMDCFESSKLFYDVIILQSVLEQLRSVSTPLYRRLKSVIAANNKRFVVFHNLFHKPSFVAKQPAETFDHYGSRCVLSAASWYAKHIPDVNIVVVSAGLIETNDSSVTVLPLSEYIPQFSGTASLLDSMLRSEPAIKKNPNNTVYFSEHFPTSKILGGVKSGQLIQGKLHISHYNSNEGHIYSSDRDDTILIIGKDNLNRAFNDDIVAVELLPQSEWKTELVTLDTVKDVDEDDSNDFLRTDSNISKKPTGKVVGIVRRNWRQYVGHIDIRSTPDILNPTFHGITNVLVTPMDRKIPKIRIRTRQAGSLVGHRILVMPDTWDTDSRYPDGHFIRDLGPMEDQDAETEAILLENDVQYQPFSQAVLDCLPKEGHEWRVPESKSDPLWNKREDLRNLQICSIDPPGCQDIDDALHARMLPNGNYECGVHIADVTHFVKPRTPMDNEAAARGTTVYLVDKRIDMLPMLLGTDLCSLKPRVERFAFSVIWELTPDAEIVSTRFTKSVIKSVNAFSYDEAQKRIDETSNSDELTKSMRMLLKLSKQLKQRRIDAGALNLASPEVSVRLENEQNDPTGVEVKELKETNSLVEEFMLLANISVAKRIYEAFPQTAMLRRHQPPPESRFEEFSKELKKLKGLKLSTKSSKAIADSLDKCIDPKDPYFNTLARIMATRCMMSAQYFASGQFDYAEFRHYGLASEIYTHFTSPIRRYADIIAHRELAAAIGYEPADSRMHKLQEEHLLSFMLVRALRVTQLSRKRG